MDLCSALRVSSGAYYHWRRKPAKLINAQELSLYFEAKRLFNEKRSGIGYVKLCRKQLTKYGMKSSMSGKGNCYNNAVVERFFGSLKYEWLASVIHLTREGIINDVNKYIRYYN